MGYRLEITDKSTNKIFYGTKLYGYYGNTIEEMKDLLSIKFLKSIDVIDNLDYSTYDGNYWDYGFNNPIDLTSEDFNKFIIFYLVDLMMYGSYVNPIYFSAIVDELIPFINTNDKHLEWG